MAWAHATVIPCPYKVVLGWTGVEGRVRFKDAARAKPWHRASLQPPSVLAWAHEINCFSSGCVHGGGGECQLVPAVFNFFSGAERSKHFLGWSSWKQERQSATPTAPARPVLLQAGSRYQTWWETTALLVMSLDAPQCFPAHKKYLGTSEGAAGSEQARPISVLFWGTWLSGQWVRCYSSNMGKQTRGDIYMKKQVTQKWE